MVALSYVSAQTYDPLVADIFLEHNIARQNPQIYRDYLIQEKAERIFFDVSGLGFGWIKCDDLPGWTKDDHLLWPDSTYDCAFQGGNLV